VCKVQGVGFRVWGLRFGVSGLDLVHFRVSGFGFPVPGFASKV
jgi:hypothetical protein